MKLKFIKYSLPLALSSSHSSYNSTRQSDRFLIHSSCTVESVLKSCAAFARSSRLSNDVSCTSETEKEPTEKKQGVLHRQHGRYASLPSLWVLGILTPYSRAILMRTWMVNGFWFLIVRKKKESFFIFREVNWTRSFPLEAIHPRRPPHSLCRALKMHENGHLNDFAYKFLFYFFLYRERRKAKRQWNIWFMF